jgi:hypothetical protein
MNVHVSFDTSKFDTLQGRLIEIARNETLPFIAGENEKRIKALTKSGASVTGEIFHDYGEAQKKKREAAGLGTEVKDLFFTGGMMNSFAFTPETNGGFLTVGEEYQKIALGQQTGHSGDWQYEHVFIGVSDEGMQLAAESWEERLAGRLRG